MLQVICTLFQRAHPLKVLIASFIAQSDPEWMLYIVHDGPAPEVIKKYISAYDDSRIHFEETPMVSGFYGHPNRGMMLKKMKFDRSDYVLITNDDNYYVPDFVKIMMGLAKAYPQNIGMVYCNTLHSYLQYRVLETKLKVDHIDMGSFIVRADIAMRIGFNHNNFSADGTYAVDCSNHCRRSRLVTKYVNRALFVHN